MRLAKHEKVGLLLLSMGDYLPTVTGARLDSSPGPQASAFVPCGACAGCGRLNGVNPCVKCRDRKREGNPIRRPNHGCRMCQVCDGRGDRRRRSGDEPFDPYSGLPLTELEQVIAEAALSRAQERAREALRATVRPTQPSGDELPWLRLREAYRASGSYAELDRALAWLADRYPLRHEMLSHWLTSVDDPLWEWSERALSRVDETIRLLAHRMPDPVRVPSFVVRGHDRAGLLPSGRAAA